MKTNVKKLFSMLLAMAMILGTMSSVSIFAEENQIEGLYVEATGSSTVTYSNAKAYSGSRSIVVDAKGNYVGLGDPVADFQMDPSKAYGLEFYIYVDSWTSGKIELKPTGNDNNTYPTVYSAALEHGGAGLYLNGTNKARWGLEKIESGEKAGWYRVWNTTAINSEDHDFSDVAGFGKGRMWYFDGTMKVYLDNIKVFDWTGYTTSQNSGTRGENPIFTQDFEKSIVVPTLPNAEDLDTEDIGLTLANGAGYTNTGAVYGITDAIAYTGEKSLYVDSTANIVDGFKTLSII